MKRILLLAFALLSFSFAFAQQDVRLDSVQFRGKLQIGDSNGTIPTKQGAVLELYGDKAILLPVTDTAVVAAPQQGFFVYKDSDNFLYYFDGTSWVRLATTADLSTLDDKTLATHNMVATGNRLHEWGNFNYINNNVGAYSLFSSSTNFISKNMIIGVQSPFDAFKLRTVRVAAGTDVYGKVLRATSSTGHAEWQDGTSTNILIVDGTSTTFSHQAWIAKNIQVFREGFFVHQGTNMDEYTFNPTNGTITFGVAPGILQRVQVFAF